MGILERIVLSLFGSSNTRDNSNGDFEVFSGPPGPDGILPPFSCQLDLAEVGSIAASQSGPDGGVRDINACAPSLQLPWDAPADWVYGNSISMYDASPVTARRSGDPIADCFVALGYPSGALLAVADGVNWGEPARRAARCAVLGATAHLQASLLRMRDEGVGTHGTPPQGVQGTGTGAKVPGSARPVTSSVSSDAVFAEMLNAVHAAQRLIKQQCGTMTTLVLTLVLPVAAPATRRSFSFPPASPRANKRLLNMRSSRAPTKGAHSGAHSHGAGGTQWVALTLTVGDSPAYVWRSSSGRVQELTAAAHAGTVRDPRWTPGALGYALGDEPDLANLTASITHVAPEDIVFLASDGVADNFDPIILKTARHAPYASEVNLMSAAEEGSGLPLMTPEQVEAAAVQGIQDTISAISAISAVGTSPSPSRSPSVGSSSGSSRRGKSGRHGVHLTARQLADGVLAHVYEATAAHRKHVEETAAAAAAGIGAGAGSGRLPSGGERSLATDGPRRTSLSNIVMTLPGKMDHATVAAFQVGCRPVSGGP